MPNRRSKAQHDFGYTTYELAFKKKNCELLDVELNAAERRAILRQHVAELDQPKSSERPAGVGADDAIDETLYEVRAQLNASGLDTGRIDALIEQRKANG
jgi:hypothetical protein